MRCATESKTKEHNRRMNGEKWIEMCADGASPKTRVPYEMAVWEHKLLTRTKEGGKGCREKAIPEIIRH